MSERSNSKELSRSRQLVLKTLDVALSSNEASKLQQLVADSAELRREYAQLQRTEETA